MPSSRTVIRWASLLIALAGWAGAVVSWVHHGLDAGVRPGYIAALSVGIAFTNITYKAWMHHKDDDRTRERMYALGVRHGLALGAEVANAKAEPREGDRKAHLRAV